jgi:RNA polymerase-binding transcription factor DksA
LSFVKPIIETIYMSLDTKTLNELKLGLEEEKKRIEGELGQIASPTEVSGEYETRHDDLGSSQDDNAIEAGEYVDNKALEENLEKQLREIKEALSRIEDGTFGFCANCGQEISAERLQAYPAAKNCLQCK